MTLFREIIIAFILSFLAVVFHREFSFVLNTLAHFHGMVWHFAENIFHASGIANVLLQVIIFIAVPLIVILIPMFIWNTLMRRKGFDVAFWFWLIWLLLVVAVLR